MQSNRPDTMQIMPRQSDREDTPVILTMENTQQGRTRDGSKHKGQNNNRNTKHKGEHNGRTRHSKQDNGTFRTPDLPDGLHPFFLPLLPSSFPFAPFPFDEVLYAWPDPYSLLTAVQEDQTKDRNLDPQAGRQHTGGRMA